MRLFALSSENNKTKTEIEEKINCASKRENIKEDVKLFKIKLRYIKRAIKKNTIQKSRNIQLLSRSQTDDIDHQVSKHQMYKKVAAITDMIKQLEETKISLRKAQSIFVQSFQRNIFPLEIFQKMSLSSSSRLKNKLEEAVKNMNMSFTVIQKALAMPKLLENDQTSIGLVCQFTNFVADVHGITLPAAVSLLDFDKLDEENFAKNVGKVKMNVRSLSLIIGVEPGKIRKDKVFHNFNMMLLKTREGIVLIENDVVAIESAFDIDNNDSDCDEEWENVMDKIEEQGKEWEYVFL